MIFIRAKKAAAAANLEYIETLGPFADSGAVAVDATGPNRKLIIGGGWGSGSSRTLSTLSYNGVAATIAVQSGGSTQDGSVLGYVDDADLPTDAPSTHTLEMTISGAGDVVVAAVHYRNIAQGAAVDTDSDVTSPFSITLTGLSASAVAVGNITRRTSDSFTWSDGTERTDLVEANLTASMGTNEGGTSLALTAEAAGGTTATRLVGAA